jgi:hypothetical protein
MGGIVSNLTSALGLDEMNRSSSGQTSNLSMAGASGNEVLGHEVARDEFKTLTDILRGDTIARKPFNQYMAGNEQYANQLGNALGQIYGDSNSLYSAFAGLAGTDYNMNNRDINQAQQYASNLYAPDRAALEQSFRDQTVDSNRLAASLGRSTNDPILQAKLRTGFMDQMSTLNARQTASAQEIAFQLPQQRMAGAQLQGAFLGSQLGTLNNYSSIGAQRVSAFGTGYNAEQAVRDQATQNRMTLFNLGNQLQQEGQNFRLASAGRTTTGYNQGSTFDTLGKVAGLASAGMGMMG